MNNDALEIANLKALYCATADSAAQDVDGARAGFAEMFTDEFIGDYGMGDPMIGPQAITDFMCTAIAGNSEWMIHFLTSPRIVVDGDTATGDWAILVHAKRRDGQRMEIVGRYRDEFHRTGQGWRIAKITFRQST